MNTETLAKAMVSDKTIFLTADSTEEKIINSLGGYAVLLDNDDSAEEIADCISHSHLNKCLIAIGKGKIVRKVKALLEKKKVPVKDPVSMIKYESLEEMYTDNEVMARIYLDTCMLIDA